MTPVVGGCVDCPAGSRRPATRPGPRCATHQRARRKAAREAAHGRHVKAHYGITTEEYWAILEAQGGRCALCQWATGKTKKLAVDHDHACCPGRVSCGRCVRQLLCSPCNVFLGRIRDSSAALRRAADNLENPPAQAVLRRMRGLTEDR